MEEQKQAQRTNQERTPFVCILESLWLVENTESVDPDCILISLKVPSHQIRLGLKWYGWIGLGEYKDCRWLTDF
jgi:hypothetical protein